MNFSSATYYLYSLPYNMLQMTRKARFYPSQWIKCKWSTTNLMPICQDYYIFTVNFWFEKNCRLHLLYDTLSVLYDIFHRLAMQWYEVCNCVSLQIVSTSLFVKTHRFDNVLYFSSHYPIDFEILRLNRLHLLTIMMWQSLNSVYLNTNHTWYSKMIILC